MANENANAALIGTSREVGLFQVLGIPIYFKQNIILSRPDILTMISCILRCRLVQALLRQVLPVAMHLRRSCSLFGPQALGVEGPSPELLSVVIVAVAFPCATLVRKYV